MELADLLGSPVALVAAGVFGALWGSFFNVCIARVPRGMSVVKPGSHCFSCGAPVPPWHNIPIISYLVLRGRCRTCGARFSPRYLLIEMLAGCLAVLVFWKFVALVPGLPVGQRLARFALYFAFSGVLLVLSFIDLDTWTLPDVITLPAIPVLFLAGFGAGDVPWTDRLIGAVAGYLFVRIVSDAYFYIRGREGLGLGDGKLLAVIGAVLGWRAMPFVVFLASFLGVLVAVPVLLARRKRQAAEAATPAAPPTGETPAGPPSAEAPDAAQADEPLRFREVPFGPFLALAALIYLFFWPDLQSVFLLAVPS